MTDRYKFWYSRIQKYIPNIDYSPKYPLFARLDTDQIVEYTECVMAEKKWASSWDGLWSDSIYVGEGIRLDDV